MEFNLPDTIIALSSVLGVILLHVRQTRKSKELDQSISKKIDAQTEEWKLNLNTQIKKANGVPWAFIENLPIPAWAKDLDGRMVWINTEYSIRFGIRPTEYEGRTDFDVWPSDIATKFRRNDRKVQEEKITLKFLEDIPDNFADPNSHIEVWTVWKFPIFDENRRVKAVGGIAVPKAIEGSLRDF